jgi:hypothetical protein
VPLRVVAQHTRLRTHRVAVRHVAVHRGGLDETCRIRQGRRGDGAGAHEGAVAGGAAGAGEHAVSARAQVRGPPPLAGTARVAPPTSFASPAHPTQSAGTRSRVAGSSRSSPSAIASSFGRAVDVSSVHSPGANGPRPSRSSRGRAGRRPGRTRTRPRAVPGGQPDHLAHCSVTLRSAQGHDSPASQAMRVSSWRMFNALACSRPAASQMP